MSTISCHILDTSQGVPAAAVCVSILDYKTKQVLASGNTNNDGRLLFDNTDLDAGSYTLRFEVEAYLLSHFNECFFPLIEVHFNTREERHYHIPLLLSSYSYSSYRGT